MVWKVWMGNVILNKKEGYSINGERFEVSRKEEGNSFSISQNVRRWNIQSKLFQNIIKFLLKFERIIEQRG